MRPEVAEQARSLGAQRLDLGIYHDVTVTAPLNLPASMPEHASELYARNVVALLELMLDDAGALVLNRVAGGDDEVLVGSCVTREERT